MWSTLVNVALFAAVNQVAAQGDLSMANNVTDLEGTWSSNVAVSTGNVSITLLHTTSASARTEGGKAVRKGGSDTSCKSLSSQRKSVQ